jgi:hypothetical protein
MAIFLQEVKMDWEERRREKRYNKEELPKVLRTFMLGLDGGKYLKAETLDASANGISLLVPVHCGSISEAQVTLTSLDNSVKLTDDILYVQPRGSQASRICIMFAKENFLKPYINRT